MHHNLGDILYFNTKSKKTQKRVIVVCFHQIYNKLDFLHFSLLVRLKIVISSNTIIIYWTFLCKLCLCTKFYTTWISLLLSHLCYALLLSHLCYPPFTLGLNNVTFRTNQPTPNQMRAHLTHLFMGWTCFE